MNLLTIVNNNQGTDHLLCENVLVDAQNNLLKITTWNKKRINFIISNIKCYWEQPATEEVILFFTERKKFITQVRNDEINTDTLFPNLLNDFQE